MKKGTIIFNKDLTTIGKEAFKDCENLTSITIPKKVNGILANAFQNCMNLNELYYKGVKDDFTKIKLDSNWLNESSVKYVHCEDESINVNYNYLTFTALEDGEIGFYVNEYNQVQPTIEYSFDKINWHAFINEEFVTVLKDQNIYCRGLNPNGINERNAWSGGVVNGFYQNSGIWNVSGNIMTLIDYINPITEIVGEFSYLFGNDEDRSKYLPNGERLLNIINASKLELPATTLASNCYYGMFDNCDSLTTAPELPVTTLADGCYYYMFRGCTSLITAPELPATTLAESCYDQMFRNCGKLNYIKCLATDMSATNCTNNWVRGVSNTGTFVKHPDATWSTGVNGIPSGWEVVDAEI